MRMRDLKSTQDRDESTNEQAIEELRYEVHSLTITPNATTNTTAKQQAPEEVNKLTKQINDLYRQVSMLQHQVDSLEKRLNNNNTAIFEPRTLETEMECLRSQIDSLTTAPGFDRLEFANYTTRVLLGLLDSSDDKTTEIQRLRDRLDVLE